MSLDEPKGHIGFTLNGDEITVPARSTARLSEVLRDVAAARCWSMVIRSVPA